MKSMVIVSLAGTALAVSSTSVAHHSAAVLFDLAQEVSVEGTVTRFTLGNPHARIYMTVENAEGEATEWMAEGGSRTVLYRNGWSEEDIRPGDVVTVIGNPSRDGSPIIHWEKIILPDGTERWGEDIPEDSVLEDLRRRR
jgi:phenylpropionate dioxygenase-like ring-hydroxylating dioxygenase large terminal subunit